MEVIQDVREQDWIANLSNPHEVVYFMLKFENTENTDILFSGWGCFTPADHNKSISVGVWSPRRKLSRVQRAESVGDGAMYDSWKQLEREGWGEKWEKTKPQETNERVIKRKRMAACSENSWWLGRREWIAECCPEKVIISGFEFWSQSYNI